MIARRRLLPALLALAGGCASPPPGVRSAAIVGGSDDASDGAVVALLDRRSRCDETDLRIVCTGTLIAPRVVLTAAHCLREQGTAGTWEVYFGSPVGGDAQGRFMVVTDAVTDPGWDPVTHELDLALLRLSDAAPVAAEPFATAALPSSLVGATARVVGYGETAPGVVPDGARRQTTMKVSSIDAKLFRADPSPGNSCGGDSGGPMLADLGSGEELVGVTVSGDPTCQTYALQARVDVAVADFIQPYLDATAAAPAGRPAGAIDPSVLCQTECSSAADCPDALACEPASPVRPATCSISQAPPASFGASCAHDADCGSGGSCARLWPDGADACRCSKPCAGSPPPMVPKGGCAIDGGAPAPTAAAMMLLAVPALARARRRRRS